MRNRDRHCTRCGKPEWSEEALSARDAAEDDGRLSLPDNWLSGVEGGAVCCWDCHSQVERRAAEDQCGRCGVQYHDDGRGSDAGWISSGRVGVPLLCPACQTPEEDMTNTFALLEMVERGQRVAAAGGREYPADLAQLAERERDRIERQQQDVDALNRRLTSDEEED